MSLEWDGEERFCPVCGDDIVDFPACPGYTQNGRKVSCMPPCGNAWEFLCTSDECDWSYTWGLGQQASWYEANEAHRPSWLVGNFMS